MSRLSVTTLLLACVMGFTTPQNSADDARARTIHYISRFESPDGGYRAEISAPMSELGATSSALRAVKYSGAKPPHPSETAVFIQKCFDPATGSFANTPGGATDVRSTAMGVMAAAELKMSLEGWKPAIIRYFANHARTLPDIYIAAASLHAAGLDAPPDTARAWIAEFEKSRNPDGSYGKTIADTGGAVITTFRLGGTLADPATATRHFKAAQKSDGGFGVADTSDLSTTYRVMRALYMLKAAPDVDGCRGFVAKCRNPDGGYGPSPGKPSSLSTTYFASIILHWLDEMQRDEK